ncbi:replication restart helicase PriA [Oribacterium sp. WCC10]|uniref:replication restart helicase PriA n=1 Tax=Oribacterium sp. WCC10 TaxID=1855343 RepID=UPI0008ECDC2A|nr:primosomal protein N' [Oribacterium sp. WCC10]SFG56534.1 replication restart DNA helicase PriA [Oribacterium sp. WCC10]
MYAQIIIDITSDALDKAYTYRIPDGMEVHTGDRVSIPFGISNAIKTGYVIGLTDQVDYDPAKVKEINSVMHDAISVKEQLIHLASWMSSEYGTTLNQCLKTVLPVKRAVRKNSRRIDPLLRYASEKDEYHELNEEQQAAADTIISGFRRCISGTAGETPRYLLNGITGSGKTEVYLHVMEQVIKAGYKVIMLIPEISLTYQTVIRVSTRFRGKVAILNSRMSTGERYEQYMKCESGEVDILIGPRSAVFAPFEKLGMIIMDEEHEGAYKAETAPRYETRDVAYHRAKQSHCPVLYGSATPSVHIYTKALQGEISLLELHRRAKSGSSLAATEIIDLRAELEKGNRSIFSDRLYELITDRLNKHEQIMLFMNRRGYSSFVSCRSCGQAIRCPHCDVSLTLHRDGTMRCHYCGYEIPVMKKCPTCGSPYLAPFGFGTEKLESHVKKTFPNASVLRMDADTTKNKGGHEKILEQFRNHNADILIGTQMIVKGHDFPDVTLVGLIAADLSLSAPDFHASEKTFQLITQAAGRAGRDKGAGNVIIQTYQPDHYAIVLSSAQNYKLFYEKEIAFRKLMGYPPVEYLMTIQLLSKDEDMLDMISKSASEPFKADCTEANAEFIGPLNASVYKVNDIYRKIVYIKHPEHDIIIQLRDKFTAHVRSVDKRGFVMLNYDIQ